MKKSTALRILGATMFLTNAAMTVSVGESMKKVKPETVPKMVYDFGISTLISLLSIPLCSVAGNAFYKADVAAKDEEDLFC